MIQMQRNRHRTVLRAVFAHGVADALLVPTRLASIVPCMKSSSPSIKALDASAPCKNRAGMQQFMDANRRLNLPDAVHVERA